MILSMEEAREVLRVDGDENDIIIYPLVESLPSYLEVTTGRSWDDDPVHPLAKTLAGFLLMLWFDQPDSKALKRSIDSLTTSLTALGRTYG